MSIQVSLSEEHQVSAFFFHVAQGIHTQLEVSSGPAINSWRSTMTKRYIQSTLVTLVALLLSCGALEAQTITGAVTGTVTDPTGAVIPNAKVMATNVDTGIETPSNSNTEGIYN